MQGYGYEGFVYAGKEIPPYGDKGQVLVKHTSANYYTTWRSIDHMINDNGGIIDEGEY